MEEKSQIRTILEQIEESVHAAWLKDLDKTQDLKQLISILQKILQAESIEEYFDNRQSDYEYFLKKFSNEVIINILRNDSIQGINGDNYAIDILNSYLNIFLKTIDNYNERQEYYTFFESIKEIFDPKKNFYRIINISNINPKLSIDQISKKRMSPEYYNVKIITLNL